MDHFKSSFTNQYTTSDRNISLSISKSSEIDGKKSFRYLNFRIKRKELFRFFLLVCQYLNSTNYFFAITHFRFQSPSVLHRLLTQIRIPHLSVNSLSNMTLNSYTLHMQPSSHHYSLAIHDLVEHFDWGHEHNKLVFIYERQSSRKSMALDFSMIDLYFRF